MLKKIPLQDHKICRENSVENMLTDVGVKTAEGFWSLSH